MKVCEEKEILRFMIEKQRLGNT